MINKVCRITPLLVTSAGIIATTATARAGLGMHRQKQRHGGRHPVGGRLFSPSKASRPSQLPNCRRVEIASRNAFSTANHTKE